MARALTNLGIDPHVHRDLIRSDLAVETIAGLSWSPKEQSEEALQIRHDSFDRATQLLPQQARGPGDRGLVLPPER